MNSVITFCMGHRPTVEYFIGLLSGWLAVRVWVWGWRRAKRRSPADWRRSRGVRYGWIVKRWLRRWATKGGGPGDR